MNASSEILNIPYPLVLFDGVCNLCDASIRCILKGDPQKKFRFASLQSPLGKKMMEALRLKPNDLHTMVLVEGGKFYFKSSAVLRIAKEMKAGFFTPHRLSLYFSLHNTRSSAL